MTNAALANELIRTRTQRDSCAANMAGVAKWRADALARAKIVQ